MSFRQERSGIQLAEPATEKLIQKIGLDGKVFSQPKLNGERCRTQWFAEEPYLISSYNNEFQFTHTIKSEILEQCNKFGIDPLPLDGEIYVHGWPRERIHSAISRKKNYNPDVEQLEYHIFDLQLPHLPQYNRVKILLELEKQGFFDTPHLKLVSNRVIQVEDWLNWTVEYIAQGYEGIILRNPASHYQFKRIRDMLKFKPTEKDEYIVVGVKEGTGWAEGMLGSFLVRGDDGTVFAVGTGPELTKPKRIEYWKIRDTLPGNILIVKHEKIKTTGGIPICTSAYELKLK